MQHDGREDEAFRLRLALLRERARRLEQDHRLIEAEARADELQAENAVLRGSLSFGLGRALLDAAKSPRELVRLPKRIIALARVARERNPPALPASAPATPAKVVVASVLGAVNVAGGAPTSLSSMRIAAVLDTFSHQGLAPECELRALHPDHWREQIDAFAPHVLFVESCWQGVAGEWDGKVSTVSDVLRALVSTCRAGGIPTVFWNKEDPLHYEAFIGAARLFDHVFTTDADCIPRYKRDLRHDRVGLMPFALQPATFHPIADGARKPAFFFAGAYYPHLTERARDFRAIVDALSLVSNVEIYDRNYDRKAAGHHVYPTDYRWMVRGGVPYSEIAPAYRAFAAGINLNTIKQSPTMFARRVLELIGCGTSVYGNQALGIARLFGDLVVHTDDQERLFDEAWQELRSGDPRARMRRVAALRKALRDHTYAHRLAHIARSIGWSLDVPALPSVAVVTRVRDDEALARVLADCARQSHAPARILVDAPASVCLPAHVETWSPATSLAGQRVALFDPRDRYGVHYLEDLALATRYSNVVAIAKAGVGEDEYRTCTRVAPRRALIAAAAFEATMLDGGEHDFASAIRIDGFEHAGDSATLPETPSLDAGVEMDDALAFAAAMPAAAPLAPGDTLTAERLADAFRRGTTPTGTSVFPKLGRLEICAKLDGRRTAKLRSAVFPRDALMREGTVRFCVDALPDPSMTYGVEQVDATGRVLAQALLPAQIATAFAPIEGATGYRLTLQVRGTLTRYLDGVALVERAPPPLFLPGRGRLLVVTNGYPSIETPYRNAFVHRRVLRYRRRGIGVDVVCAIRGQQATSYEYEGVTVALCDPSVLKQTLAVSKHAAIAVHFLDAGIWHAIRDAAAITRTVVWVHGSDIQPYERRAFNYTTDAERAHAQRESLARTALWREVVTQAPAAMDLVFVSRAFAEEAWSDLGVRLPEARWRVIHNPIDDDLFSGPAKAPEARFRILSIRPHASRIYANDLVAAVIRGLSAYPEFSSVHFHLVGDGPLFDENFDGLAAFGNVTIDRRLLRQEQIAALHRDHGLFLVPTRGDTQGVSRDEAMASGLVPVTNLVGAVGEFTDPGVALLAGPEDVEAMVQGIRQLLADPDRFLRMSRAAASRVRAQSAADRIVGQELSALGLLGGADETGFRIQPAGEVQPDPSLSF